MVGYLLTSVPEELPKGSVCKDHEKLNGALHVSVYSGVFVYNTVSVSDRVVVIPPG